MLKIRNLSKSFNKSTDNEINVFSNFQLEIEANKCTAIIGPNGCGKSTLLNIIGGNIPSDEGQIFLNKKDISAATRSHRCASPPSSGAIRPSFLMRGGEPTDRCRSDAPASNIP